MKTRYDFDTIIDRHDTGAMKYDGLDAMFGRHDVTPMWIADLDFAVCPDITAALRHRLDHPVLGYAATPESYWQSIIDWQRRRHGFNINRDELSFIPGVVKGIALALNYFTQRGDKVVIQPPVYHPFCMVIEGNERQVVENPLIERDGTYTMDLDGLERILEHERPVMMVLCNPHNPIGLQWDAETLKRLATMCRKAGCLVVSDEIHGDLMLDRRPHVPFLDVSDDAREIGIMLGAPSKTFNIPGLVSSWMVVKNRALRDPFYHWLEVNEFNSPVLISTIGAEAAYCNGEEWLDQMLEYVSDNITFLCRTLDERGVPVSAVMPEASFLVWLDFRSLGLEQAQLMHLLLDKAHLALNDGAMFGRQGEGFMRLNVGVPRSVLASAIDHICDAVNTLKD